MKVAAIIPAHNEADQIAATVESVKAQLGVHVSPIVVVADNCIDETAERARDAGAVVVKTVDNRSKKAGALNQGWEYLSRAHAPDFVLQMDADTVLDTSFVSRAMIDMDGRTAGVCARFLTKPNSRGLLGLLQRMEYQRLDAHSNPKKGHRTHCLSGTATLLRAAALPKRPWDERSLVEDYALTLDLRERGWGCKRASASFAYTETKPTLREFWSQRIRWAKGTLDELRRRGWRKTTRKTWLLQAWAYFVVAARWLWVSLVIWTLLGGGSLHLAWYWLLPVPIILLERVKSVWPLGWRARTTAALWVADEAYQLLWEAYMLRALWLSLTGREISWEGGEKRCTDRLQASLRASSAPAA